MRSEIIILPLMSSLKQYNYFKTQIQKYENENNITKEIETQKYENNITKEIETQTYENNITKEIETQTYEEPEIQENILIMSMNDMMNVHNNMKEEFDELKIESENSKKGLKLYSDLFKLFHKDICNIKMKMTKVKIFEKLNALKTALPI